MTTLLFSLLALPATANGQTSELSSAVKAHITLEGLTRHARAITEHERPSGSPGENAAIDYVVETLQASGVPLRVHEIRAYTSDPVSARVTVPGTDFDPDAITLSFSGATPGVEGPLLDLGDLDDLPELEVGTGERLVVRGAERFARVRGRIAVVTGQPRNVPTTALEELGALAVVYVNPEERLNDLIVTSTWGTPSLLNAHRLPALPVAQIRRSDGERLRTMMAGGEVRARVSTEVATGWKELRVAVAEIAPPDAGDDAPFVLFGGHIDAWYHGGTDEGASNAAMLELAIAFHAERASLRRGLRVAWWPGHSNARYGGSTWYADTFFDELRTRGIAYVNVDGIGQKDARRFGASTSPALARLAEDVVRGATRQGIRPSRPGRNSDQAFNGAGVALLQISHSRTAEDGGYWWWHTPDDTYDKIDVEVLKVDTDLYADALASLLADPALPLDLPREVEALEQALSERERQSGSALDLSEAREGAARLAALLADADAAGASTRSGAALDLARMRVLRPLHRVMFVPGSDHHPDPGIHGSPLPGLEPARVLSEEPLDSDRYGFALAYLLRERNRVHEAIDEAAREAERLLVLLRSAS
ncbi:MAG TPA: M28 family peptidase [Longimicrobiales bacterium]|nr:M28 family peptidase [Longimicrobiales bacterium]